LTPEDYSNVLLAITVWREARGEGPEGMRAVANVIRNRAAKLQLGSDVEKLISIITSKNQFSSMTILGDTQTVLWPKAADFETVQNVCLNAAPDNTNGALFYANEGAVTSEWYLKNIIQNPAHSITATIGKQTFRA
jgi:spore germination cell wall hydrolase CwlJ-like protein